MPHSFDVFGTPRAERPAGPRDAALPPPGDDSGERVGLFHHTRTVAKSSGEEVDVIDEEEFAWLTQAYALLTTHY